MKVIETGHLARVEGNGNVVVKIENKDVKEVQFQVLEGPRLFEMLARGKTPDEVVNLVPRICAICSASHKLAVIRAMENALSVKPTKKTQLVRELLHMGEQIESHSLHVYYLALPDYLGYPNAVALAPKFPLEVKIALEMKAFANQVMKLIAGRYIHGENPVIGGFGKLPAKDDLLLVKRMARQFMPFTLKTTELFNTLPYPDTPESDTAFACLNPAGGKFGFMGEEILVSTGDQISVQDYRKLTNETVKAHSFCKRSLYKGKPFSVGALARVNLLGERLGGEAGKMFKKFWSPKWKRNPLYNNAAQALEILYAMERIPPLVDEILQLPDEPPVKVTAKAGKGAGAVEAPRGTLYHYYEISDGLCTAGDIITPTAQNADDIEKFCFEASKRLLAEKKEDGIVDMLHLIVRAYDPCISCSVHLIDLDATADNVIMSKI
jgi:sulfhydrogenase subunit alpha